MKSYNTAKYIIVFLITAIIFVIAFYASNYINNKKVDEIKATEDKVSISILSLETQFELLQESTCANFDQSSLATELTSLADKLSYADDHNEIDNKEVTDLKKYYSLLEIKDFLLMKKVSDKCKQNPIVIIYFYSNTQCDDCSKQGYVLTYVRENYPGVRVYTFDYDLDLPAIRTLINIHKIQNVLPALIINDKTYNGFQSVDAIQSIIGPVETKTATSTATTTHSKK